MTVILRKLDGKAANRFEQKHFGGEPRAFISYRRPSPNAALKRSRCNSICLEVRSTTSSNLELEFRPSTESELEPPRALPDSSASNPADPYVAEVALNEAFKP